MDRWLRYDHQNHKRFVNSRGWSPAVHPVFVYGTPSKFYMNWNDYQNNIYVSFAGHVENLMMIYDLIECMTTTTETTTSVEPMSDQVDPPMSDSTQVVDERYQPPEFYADLIDHMFRVW